MLSKNCSLKIHSQNCCLIKFFFKKYIFKTTLSKSFLFKKSTFPKLLCQKKHFQISKNINLIALIYSSSYSSNSSEEEKITQIIMNICNYFFLNIFTLLKRLVDNSVHACESRIQANYCWKGIIWIYLMNFFILRICNSSPWDFILVSNVIYYRQAC